jgi:hypothetical protein
MKTRFVFCLGVGLTMLAAPQVLRAGLVNGSFESWDLLGWSLRNDVGIRDNEPFTRTTGNARTVAAWEESSESTPQVLPLDGHRFLSMGTRASANFLGDGTYNLFISQSVSLKLGDTISGWSSFMNGDSEPNDSAWARIRDHNENLVANLWMQTSGTGVTITEWKQWNWTAETAGHYTIELGMTTHGANNSASYGFFDGISITAVPEPTPILLGLLGGLTIVALRNRGR